MKHLSSVFKTKEIILSILLLALSFGTSASERIRTLRYSPEGTDLVIVNGERRFNRALYGTNTAFRVEAGDLPEFGLFMPNMGGNISFGILSGGKSLSLNDCRQIKAVYRSGSYLYEISDPMLGEGRLLLQVLAMGDAEGIVWQVEGKDLPTGTALICSYGGATDKRFYRNGDLGVDDPDGFALKKENCRNNRFNLNENHFDLSYGKDGSRQVQGVFPVQTELKIGDASLKDHWDALWKGQASAEYPLLLSKTVLKPNEKRYFAIKKADGKELAYKDLPACLQTAEQRRASIAGAIEIQTPDRFLNPLGGIIATASDGIWDDQTQSWQHGAIGWRMPLNGWRGAYAGDVMGWHDRARLHFDGYAASQITDILPSIPHPAQDSALALARAVKKWGTQMYSNGYICRNPRDKSKMHHYDMNLCYIDELLWHFNWTGDMDYVRSMWPVLQRHLAWEKRNFDPDGDGLYNAYACIWASDALQYSGGGVTHASAYNYRANKMAAEIAAKLGEDPEPYQKEAEKIQQAMNARLWLNEKGTWAEYVDLLGKQSAHPSAGVWTIYHAIDSEVHTPFQSYLATRYVDEEIPHIPIETAGKGELDGEYAVISTTNWFPYSWSVNNVAFAEIAHTSLAYWQAGRYDEGLKLFKSALLDGMYMGGSPGNIGQISFYDAARGECYRDFADPVGVYGRVLVQGLFGILPDMMNRKVCLKPGFPSDWEHASIKASDIAYSFRKEGDTDRYLIRQEFGGEVEIELLVKARKNKIQSLTVNNQKVDPELLAEVGHPLVKIRAKTGSELDIRIEWGGSHIGRLTSPTHWVKGEKASFSFDGKVLEVFDPQEVLSEISRQAKSLEAVIAREGKKSFFVRLQSGEMSWWQAVDLNLSAPLSCRYDQEDVLGRFSLKNERNRATALRLLVNPGSRQYEQELSLKAGQESEALPIPASSLLSGRNRLVVFEGENKVLEQSLYFPEANSFAPRYEMVNMDKRFNAFVKDIFRNEYLSPRSPYTTLQIPKQGIGEWCHPLLMADIDDSGFRQSIRKDVFHTPTGLPFRSPGDTLRQNIVYTSLWDNYPATTSVSLKGKARQACLLMAGSTNHMQCHIDNGLVKVYYKDGSSETLALRNPDTWVPIEQDLYIDDHAFATQSVRAPRLVLKTGLLSRNLETDLDIKGVYGRSIPGGAAIVLDMPLDDRKDLDRLELITEANEVVIGLMAVTLLR